MDPDASSPCTGIRSTAALHFGEYRIDWGPGYRIYLAKDGEELIVLFGGGTKRRQQADIEKALGLHAEYKARKESLKKMGDEDKVGRSKKRKR
jgi:hypothetical protein